MPRIIDLKNRRPQSQKKELEPGKVERADDIISWTGLLFAGRKNKRNAILAALALFALAAVLQIYQKNIISTIFLSLLGAVIILHAFKEIPEAEFEVSPLGVRVNDQVYPYKEIKSFWVDYQPKVGVRELSLQLKKIYAPYVKIPIGKQNPVHLRSVLVKFIPEVEHEETLTETIGRVLGL